MSHSLQVIYPVDANSSFDFDYYLSSHMDIVGSAFGDLIEKTVITKGVAGGPGTPAGYHAIATFTFADKAALDGALAKSGPAVADIPNFYSGQPQVLIGDVVA